MFDCQNATKQNKKTFVFENQHTGQSIIVYHNLNTNTQLTDLKPILNLYCPFEKNRVELFNTFQSKFMPLQKLNPIQPTLIPSQFLLYGFIMIRYKSLVQSENDDQIQEESIEHSSQMSLNKKDRSKERTIGEVIQLVKRWRRLHTGNEGKKLNLQEAAKTIGVSKKSLDDYYYQLRVGQQNQFAFYDHLNDKIGVLRMFVKEKKPEKTMKHRNSKHPKRLRIIEDLERRQESEEEMDEKKSEYMNLPQSPFLSSSQKDQFYSESESLLLGKDFEDIENKYYENFEYFLIAPDEDPFFYTGDFKKKSSFNFGGEDSDIIF